MTKHFCDICEKEITDINTCYCLNTNPMELCDNCMEACESIKKKYCIKQKELRENFEKEIKMFMKGIIKYGRK